MGKKRRMKSNKTKFGLKYKLHPALATEEEAEPTEEVTVEPLAADATEEKKVLETTPPPAPEKKTSLFSSNKKKTTKFK
jgi:hypothetical protein